jgi:HPt (histidine-containing phosphotransfer) domain-containing protein
VATDTAPDFDLGPLSWVQNEIDQAIARGLESLAAFRANTGDDAALKHARTHVHQAAGAIQMVGLDAVVAYTDELERQLARLESLPRAEVDARPRSSTARAASSGSSSTSWSRASHRFPSSSFPNTRRCSSRAARRRHRPPSCSTPT